jgi:hypothetical protein
MKRDERRRDYEFPWKDDIECQVPKGLAILKRDRVCVSGGDE